jgi:hypothetical protein
MLEVNIGIDHGNLHARTEFVQQMCIVQVNFWLCHCVSPCNAQCSVFCSGGPSALLSWGSVGHR